MLGYARNECRVTPIGSVAALTQPTYMIQNPTYIVTDVELDGFGLGVNSMLSFGSVAVSASGEMLSEFEANLARLDGAEQDPGVMEFWATEPEAFAATTHAPEAPATVMPRFVAWVRGLPGDAIFAAHPVMLDGPWIDHYLQCFTEDRLFDHPRQADRLFKAPPLCLMSLAAGTLRRPAFECNVNTYPPEWLGNHAHTHRAIDDARGYAHLLVHLTIGQRA